MEFWLQIGSFSCSVIETDPDRPSHAELAFTSYSAGEAQCARTPRLGTFMKTG